VRILVISLAGIGDTLLATPFIHELRANFPEAQIDILIRWPGAKGLLEGNPHLNVIHQRDLVEAGMVKTIRFLRQLAKNDYDSCIITHPQSRIHYRIAAWLVAARLRLSHIYDCSGMIDRLLVNRTVPQDYSRHSVEQNFDLLPLVGGRTILPKHELELFLSPEDEQWAKSFVEQNRLQGRKVLAVHAGSGETKNLALKRWPLERYIELLKRACQRWPQLAIVLLGGLQEESDLQRIIKEVQSPMLLRAKTQTLRQAAALMKRCTLFLSVDTALMHLAAAVKVRQIVIEAPTFNKTNEPYGNDYVLVRNPAVGGRNLEYYRYDGRGIQGTREELMRCMASVSVEAVLEALEKELC
jgi:ADP-heptose:LPS heptosyltransferase